MSDVLDHICLHYTLFVCTPKFYDSADYFYTTEKVTANLINLGRLCRSKASDHRKNGTYGEDRSMGPYGNTGGLFGGVFAGGYGGYGTYGAYTGEDGVLTYDINAEGVL